MHLSYDPPDQTLAEIMSDALDEVEGAYGADPSQDAVVVLHSKLLLHGKRHHLHSDGTGEVVLRMPPSTASWLATLAADSWKARGT
jgi:hypothetical protein